MRDSIMAAVPLLVLAVVLLLGFAGCGFEHGVAPGTEPQSLTFTVRVPAPLRVIGPGVTFTWERPNGQVQAMTVPPKADPSIEAYITAALNLGPSLLWTLGSANGLTDRSGNGRDGTPLGGVTVGGSPNAPTDLSDATATLFDGNDDGIGSSYNPFVGTTARTFVGWARWDSGGPAEHTLFGSSAGDNNRPNLRLVAANRDIKWLPSGDDGQVITWPAAAAAQDTWFMWVLRTDPGNGLAALFIDGAKVSEQPMAEPWPASPGTFQAALGAATRHPFKGAQGLVSVYEAALTDMAVTDLHEASHAANPYEYQVPVPVAGNWQGRCEMVVQEDTQTAYSVPPYFPFTLANQTLDYVLTFKTMGGPLNPPFEVTVVGLTP